MNSVERVLKTIRHEEPDRVPLNLWNFRDDVRRQVCARFGSVEAFDELCGLDIFMAITPPPNRTNPDFREEQMTMDPGDIRDHHFFDPDDKIIYQGVENLLARYRGDKAVFVHHWGVLESLYSFIGVEKTLLLLAQDPHQAHALFEKMAAFSRRVAENVCALGIDVFHLSGDVGANRSMLVSPAMWRRLIQPYDDTILQVARRHRLPISLHSCGYFLEIIPDLIDMGVQVMHPLQESAGMDQLAVKQRYGAQITLHGGLDVRQLPTLTSDQVEALVCRKMQTLKPGGGFIFNTGHTIQPDTSLDVVLRAYQAAQQYGCYD